MAKGSGNKGGGGASKIRFIMLEAELVDGDLDQVTQAISNALRPAPTVVQQRLIAASPPARDLDLFEVEDAEVISREESDTPPPSETSRARVAQEDRKYARPHVVTEVDLETSVSFPEFAAGKRPKSQQDKYLIAAAWFKLHRGVDEVSMHHVYTCFKHPEVKWSTTADDFDAPLRALKKANKVEKGTVKAHYAINQIGLAEVKRLGGGEE